MKKILLVAALFIGGISFLQTFCASASPIPVCAQDNYCPEGYICEATNCRALCSSDEIKGISIYKNLQGDIIAYVPGHGHLRCTKRKTNTPGGERWDFFINMNGREYVIVGYNG